MKTTKLGTLETVIVGTRPGRAHPAANTGLRLRREPENPLDPSAIAVQGKRGRAFGYLPRETAAWLARLTGSILLHGEHLLHMALLPVE